LDHVQKGVGKGEQPSCEPGFLPWKGVEQAMGQPSSTPGFPVWQGVGQSCPQPADETSIMMARQQQLLTPQAVLQENWWASSTPSASSVMKAAALGAAAAASFMMQQPGLGVDPDELQLEILKGRLIMKPKIEAVQDGGEDSK
jgi:hypothetical protein